MTEVLYDIKAEEQQLADSELMHLLHELLPENEQTELDRQCEMPDDEASALASEVRRRINAAERSKADEQQQQHNEMNRLITEAELRTAVDRTPNYKAAGGDGIKGEFLKYLGDEAVFALLDLYNLIFKHQKCPVGWTKDIAWPLFKKGNRRNPSNYRLITLMAVMAYGPGVEWSMITATLR